MTNTRRHLLRVAGAVLAAPALLKYAHAAEFAWRLGHTAPASFPLHKRLAEAAEGIALGSDGRMELTVVPDSQLGGQLGLMAQVRGGSLEATTITGQVMTTALPAMFVQSTGFAFSDYAKLWSAMDGELGRLLRGQINERLGMLAMEKVWDFGFRQITTGTKPIRTADDLAGLKIRTPVEADLINLFKALKAAPLGMNLTDLYGALRTHTVDGQDGILPLVQAAQLYNVQSFCAMTNHVWDGQWLCINPRAYQRLPDKIRGVVASVFNQSAVLQRQDTASFEADVRGDLTTKGIKFNTVEPDSFRAMLRSAGYYKDAKLRVGDEAWAALEKYTGRLA